MLYAVVYRFTAVVIAPVALCFPTQPVDQGCVLLLLYVDIWIWHPRRFVYSGGCFLSGGKGWSTFRGNADPVIKATCVRTINVIISEVQSNQEQREQNVHPT